MEKSWNSNEPYTDAVKPDTGEFGRPRLASRYRKYAGQCSRRNDLAGCKCGIDLILCEHVDEMMQCRHGSIQHIRREPVVDDRAVALQIDFEGRKGPTPIF